MRFTRRLFFKRSVPAIVAVPAIMSLPTEPAKAEPRLTEDEQIQQTVDRLMDSPEGRQLIADRAHEIIGLTRPAPAFRVTSATSIAMFLPSMKID